MEKAKAKAKIITYLKSHFIKFSEDVYNGVERLTMIYRGCENSPGKVIESSICFFTDHMDCNVYYSISASNTELCRNGDHRSELMRLLNYINAVVWPVACDGMDGELYRPLQLYVPRIYMTEDDCNDITATVLVAYDFYEVVPLQTEDFLTACLPELMDKLSIPIFMLLLGMIDLECAMRLVNDNVLCEENV